MALKKLWRKIFGIPVYVISYREAVKRRMKRLEGGVVLIKNGLGDWIVAKADGTIPGRDGEWRFESDCSYNSAKILDVILKNKTCLPVLMGLDKELDAIIAEKLKEPYAEGECE